MSNPTDTNQASEDELRQSLATLFYDDSYEYMLSEPDLFDVGAIDAVVDLIRTEKLKLLAAVRERVGEGYPYCLNNPGRANTQCNKCWVCRHRNDEDYVQGYESAQDEAAKSLTKLEAEL